MSAFSLIVVPVTPFQQNCSILICEATKKAAVVDPGGDLARIREALTGTGVSVEKILLTHGHIDHAGGAAQLAEELQIPIEGPQRKDAPLLALLAETGRGYGIADARPVEPDRWLEEGDTTKIGDLTFDVLHCPGHSPGSVVYVWRRDPKAPQGFALMGDVLFAGSIGRTDLPGASHSQLIDSIKRKLLTLPDDTAFLPGHGPAGTIGTERRSNPFLV